MGESGTENEGIGEGKIWGIGDRIKEKYTGIEKNPVRVRSGLQKPKKTQE